MSEKYNKRFTNKKPRIPAPEIPAMGVRDRGDSIGQKIQLVDQGCFTSGEVHADHERSPQETTSNVKERKNKSSLKPLAREVIRGMEARQSIGRSTTRRPGGSR